MSGRFAPSPTGPLHLGNLRTAALAWLSARVGGHGFLLRIEDLDRHQSNATNEVAQLADLRTLGIDWDGPVERQSERFDRYHEAISRLRGQGRIYECFCTRREILESTRAPHGPPGAYPGTCRGLSTGQRQRHLDAGRPPALRLRTDGEMIGFHDRCHGDVVGAVDDVVVRRNDGVPAYNLAVVVDDGEQGVTEVVRGDDLLLSTPRQILLQRLLGYRRPDYAHVGLVVGPDGERLAKRHGAITLADLAAQGVPTDDVLRWIGRSIGIDPAGDGLTLSDWRDVFDVTSMTSRTCRVLQADSH
jgi:glutamyl-tRNA synthetase